MAKGCALSTGYLPRGGLPRNSVDRITDRPDMTSAVDCGRKASNQTNKQIKTLFRNDSSQRSWCSKHTRCQREQLSLTCGIHSSRHEYTVMTLNFRTDRSGQILQTQIRLLYRSSLIRVFTVCISVYLHFHCKSLNEPLH